MANVISLTVDSVSSDLTEFTIVDGTTYSSPARGSLAAYMIVQKMNADATVAETLTITADTEDPETDAEWVVDYSEGDGWYRACFVLPPDYDVLEEYEIYDLVFDTSTDTVWRSKQNTNTGNALVAGAFWEEITGNNIALIALNEGEANESANIDSTVFEFIMTSNSEKAYASKIAEASEQYLTSTFIPDDVLDTYSIMAVLLDGAYVAGDRAEYSKGERIIDRLTSIIETLS